MKKFYSTTGLSVLQLLLALASVPCFVTSAVKGEFGILGILTLVFGIISFLANLFNCMLKGLVYAKVTWHRKSNPNYQASRIYFCTIRLPKKKACILQAKPGSIDKFTKFVDIVLFGLSLVLLALSIGYNVKLHSKNRNGAFRKQTEEEIKNEEWAETFGWIGLGFDFLLVVVTTIDLLWTLYSVCIKKSAKTNRAPTPRAESYNEALQGSVFFEEIGMDNIEPAPREQPSQSTLGGQVAVEEFGMA